MPPESPQDWLDDIAGPRPDPGQVRRLQQDGTLSPSEKRRLHEELALNQLLDCHRPPPPISSNFTSRVLAGIRRESTPSSPPTPWWLRLPRLAPALSFATLLLAIGISASLARNRATVQSQAHLAQTALAVGQSTAVTGLDADSLADFDVIHRLGSGPNPDDDALILALAQ